LAAGTIGDTLTCINPVASSDAAWTAHNSYPAACSAGTYVTTVGDTLTCTTPAKGFTSCTTYTGSSGNPSSVTCSSGNMTGGGCSVSSSVYTLYQSYPSGNGWQCAASGGGSASVTPYVRCCS
jgi:hypothetical protein